ncbi:MAG: thiamine pyrophosphate-dependent enzyme [Sphaerochaeta sp.]|uniref:transketolase-like TK C-terminal-containing protein n=1 Tax=Sphaerochaeta sp. TaxID=1972642 RepID=UPI002FC8D08B
MRTLTVLEPKELAYWNKIADLVDQFIDIPLNYRQSGHPGGSRSKVHMLISLLLSKAMRWDIRDTDKRFADKFILGCGHTIPLVYATLAVFNEALRLAYEASGDSKYLVKDAEHRALTWEDLLGFRHRGGLSGHAEAHGKTSFLKANTGPSGHGTPAAAGLAFALKRAGASEVKVFLFEGEGGLTPGSTHETMNTAWGLGLDNLCFLIDWNDYGIDGHRTSDVVPADPQSWFLSRNWRVKGTENGSDFPSVTAVLADLTTHEPENQSPSMGWFKTRKGRGYGKYDAASHGSPHPKNSAAYWEGRKQFASTYQARFVNVDGPAPLDKEAEQVEFRANLKAVADVLRNDKELYQYLADRLVEIGDSVPEEVEGYRLENDASPFADQRFWDAHTYPDSLWAKPGEKKANRAAMGAWGSYLNSMGRAWYNRPLFLAASADLSSSTNLWGFASGWEGSEGYGWYRRVGTEEGVMAPTEITEFSNAAMMCAVSSLNLSKTPKTDYDGFYTAVSTYASFSYLLYGPMRLYSQYAQDTDIRTGKILWVGAHSGPETADDSRTHFGIFSVGVHQLFPKGQVINLHPWDYNEVPVLLAAAFKTEVPIISLHVTRPEYPIPDRTALHIPSFFEAEKGAYILRSCDPEQSKGTFYVQGTSAVHSILSLLQTLEQEHLHCKIVCVTSTELFWRQSKEYQQTIVDDRDRIDSTFITTQAKRLFSDWSFNTLAQEYCLSSDWDDRWRTGGTLDEVLDEAHLSPEWVLSCIRRFIDKRKERLSQLQNERNAVLGSEKKETI